MLPLLSLALLVPSADPKPVLDQPLNTWVKRSPLPGGPPSPGLGYEGSLVWDSKHRKVIRFAGHNQGGGGEQNAETWTFDPLTAKWQLMQPNTSPPGACCNQQNVFDADQDRFLRFPAFSGSHGWHWFRENYLSNSSVWSYNLATNTWRDRRPVPTPRPAPLRCASWDSDYQVAVIFGGEGSRDGTQVYDPYTNTWHKLKPKDEPDPRSGGNMAYDPLNKLHVMFGTQFDNDPMTWTFNLSKNEWVGRKVKDGPPTDRNDPVLAYDAAAKRVIAVVRALDKTDGKEVQSGHVETWEFDAAKFAWQKVSPKREPDGWSNRSRVLTAMPELNALLLESVVNPSQKVPGVDREQQMWTYRGAEAKSDPVRPPANVRVMTEKGRAKISWDTVPDAFGYIVYRSIGDTPWAVQLDAVSDIIQGRGRRLEFTDTFFGEPLTPGMIAYYGVRTVKNVDGKTAAGNVPLTARAQPRVVDDLQVALMTANRIRLNWPNQGADVLEYHIERAPVEVFTEDQLVRFKKDTDPLTEPSVGAIKSIGKFERIAKVSTPEFIDIGIDLTKPVKVEGEPSFSHRFSPEQIDAKGKPYRYGVYAYRVRAVNALGIAGGPSAWIPTLPSSVQQVFAREDGTKCHLKWAANPEAGIKGYRVYRMDGPKVNGPGQKVVRLTADPIRETTFTDETKGTDTKRYWIVAVDALGQEGIPSAPVWGWRQFRKVYEGFTGEWHQ